MKAMSCSNKEEEKVLDNFDDDDEILKRRISSHPLFELLLETHLDCLKVGGIGELEENEDSPDHVKQLDYSAVEASSGVFEHYYDLELEENEDSPDHVKQLDYSAVEASSGVFEHYSDLDHFMEAYCLALGKLKEAMEKPQQKSMAFINNMNQQLKDLTEAEPALHPPH